MTIIPLDGWCHYKQHFTLQSTYWIQLTSRVFVMLFSTLARPNFMHIGVLIDVYNISLVYLLYLDLTRSDFKMHVRISPPLCFWCSKLAWAFFNAHRCNTARMQLISVGFVTLNTFIKISTHVIRVSEYSVPLYVVKQCTTSDLSWNWFVINLDILLFKLKRLLGLD